MINLVLTSKANHLAKKLKKIKGLNVILSKKNKDGNSFFPDGEQYSRLDYRDFKKGKIVVVHSGAPNPDSGLMELEMLLSIIVSGLKEKTIEVFFTYFPYSRQDKKFRSGELNMARWIIEKLIKNYKISRIYAIDAHFYGRSWVKHYPFINVSTLELFKKIIGVKYPGLSCLAPDIGSQRRAKIKGFKKDRQNSHEVSLQNLSPMKNLIEEKNILIIDDIIETGGTIVKTCQELKKIGARKIIVGVTHGVLAQGINRVKESCDDLYFTNSIRAELDSLDISKIVWDSIANQDIKK